MILSVAQMSSDEHIMLDSKQSVRINQCPGDRITRLAEVSVGTISGAFRLFHFASLLATDVLLHSRYSRADTDF